MYLKINLTSGVLRSRYILIRLTHIHACIGQYQKSCLHKTSCIPTYTEIHSCTHTYTQLSWKCKYILEFGVGNENVVCVDRYARHGVLSHGWFSVHHHSVASVQVSLPSLTRWTFAPEQLLHYSIDANEKPSSIMMKRHSHTRMQVSKHA